MNRTLFFWSIGLCFCLVLGLALGTAVNEVSDQEQTQAALADTLPIPAVPHRIRNKVLREHIEQFEQRHGQDPDLAQRGISVFCQSYHSGRQLDSLRYDITYTVINFLPTCPFILCDSIQGKPVVLFFPDFSTTGPEFYIPAEENLELLKGHIPKEDYRSILKRLRGQRELIRKDYQKALRKGGKDSPAPMDEDDFLLLVCVSDYPTLTLVFDGEQNLLRSFKNWYD